MNAIGKVKKALRAIMGLVRAREPKTLEEAKAELILVAQVAEEALAELEGETVGC